MTNSEIERSVASLLALLDERHLRSVVDEPLERAAAAFPWPDIREPSFWTFRELLIAFRQHLELHAFRRCLSVEDANAEAIGFLDQSSPRQAERGHEAALWEFSQSSSGAVERITHRLVEGVRMKERAARVRYALVKILPQTWDAQCEFASFVIGNFELAESIRTLPPERLAESLENLLLGFVQADGYMRSLVHGT